MSDEESKAFTKAVGRLVKSIGHTESLREMAEWMAAFCRAIGSEKTIVTGNGWKVTIEPKVAA